MTTPIGPYMNDDGDWWVPVDAASFRQARHEVVSCLQYSVPSDGHLAYIGKEKVWLDAEHEGHDDPAGCEASYHVLAYHFEERER